jgi:hypothetical protein
MSKNIRLFLIFLCAIVLANKGVASNNEGVYIAEAKSVVFFSEEYQVVNLKNEEKIVVYRPRKNDKNESKIDKKVTPRFSNTNSKKIKKNEEVKIPLKHIVFNVKNTKNENLSVLQSKDSKIIFYFSTFAKSIINKKDIFSISVYYIYFVQKQIFRELFYSVLPNLFLAKHYSFSLFYFIGIFFCILIREKSKNSVYILRRGPPVLIKINSL